MRRIQPQKNKDRTPMRRPVSAVSIQRWEVCCGWYSPKQMTLTELIACLTVKPAAILHKPLGSFTVDSIANVTIIDPAKEWVRRRE